MFTSTRRRIDGATVVSIELARLLFYSPLLLVAALLAYLAIAASSHPDAYGADNRHYLTVFVDTFDPHEFDYARAQYGRRAR